MILVYTENTAGKFKKSAFEAVSYAHAIATNINTQVVALAIGHVESTQLPLLGQHGASKVVVINNDTYTHYNAQAYAQAIAQVATAQQCHVVVMCHSFSGKGLAPRVAIALQAGYVDGAISLPDTTAGFIVRKGAFSGKAYADINITAPIKVISLVTNSYRVDNVGLNPTVETFTPAATPTTLTVKQTVQAGDKISLPEAELVVSAGRGLKGPENWGMVEELAALLGAATACSKPVSDAHWRPHSEHVGQTGIAIAPNLYIAIGISGAIQHLAGVSASKTIVVINKDPEAPFFKAADYGIVGDAFDIVPKFIDALKKFKASN